MTYTLALLSIPAPLFWEIVDALEELGVSRTYITQSPDWPLPSTAIDMSEIGLIINRDDDRDVLTSSSELVDMVDTAAKDAFLSGYHAAHQGNYTNAEAEAAWESYRPALAVQEKLNSFYKERDK